MFSFRKSITIERQPHEVFKYAANPANIPQWRTDVIETKYKGLPLQAGDKFEEIVNFGEPHSYVVELVNVTPDEKLVYKVVSGDSYHPLRELLFEQEGEHTKMTAHVSVHTDGFTRLIEPITSNMFSIKWDTYLFQLKKILETVQSSL
jgi:uncharacterized protein YndB with AHSA1/START domain